MSNKNNTNSAKPSKEKDYITEVTKVFAKQKDVKPQERVNPVDEVQKKWDMNETILKLFTENIKQDQKLRNRYAMILIIILAVDLVALITIFILGGLEILKYSDTTFNIFISGGIAEVFVLVKVIVGYLFNDNLTDSLKIIIENNNNRKNYRTEKTKQNKMNEKLSKKEGD